MIVGAVVNFISGIFKTLFGIYAIFIVIISHLIVMPCYLIIFSTFPPNTAPHAAHKVSRFWAEFLFVCFLIRVDVKGREHIDKNQTYVFVCNHRSQLDIPLFARACRNTFRFLSKIEVARIPVLGYVVKKLYITVDRKSKEDRIKSIERMKDSLIREKISVVLFPEGTRNRTDAPLLDFKDGAFRLAIDTQLPIAVLTILNSGNFAPANKFMQLRPGTLKALWSKPIETKGMTQSDIPRLKDEVRKRLLDGLQQSF